MEISVFQKLMNEKLTDVDKKRGPFFLFSVLFEEVGKLSRTIKAKNELEVKNELVDIIFFTFCLENVYDVEIEPLLFSKYVKRNLKEVSEEWDNLIWKV